MTTGLPFVPLICCCKMHIYQPYEVIADSDDCLHLKETEARERFYFVVYRALPVFMLFMLWFVLQQVGAYIPMGWNYVLAIVCLLLAGRLLLKTYVPEIKIIRNKEVFLLRKTFNGTKELTVDKADITGVQLHYHRGRKSRVVFSLATVKGKSFDMLVIPAPFLDDNHVRLIRERLEDLLHLQVQAV